jgi:ABC-2 type transport system permease protein
MTDMADLSAAGAAGAGAAGAGAAGAPVAARDDGVVWGWRLSWLRMRAIAIRHAYVLLRSPHRLFDVVLWPVVDVLLFGSLATFVASGHTSGSARAAAYLIAGIVLWHVVYQSQIAVSTGVLEESWSRNMLNLMVSPITAFEYVAGVALFGLLKMAGALGLVTVGAAIFFSFDVPALGWGLLPIFAILLFVGWAIALFVVGVVFRYGAGAEALAWGVLFVVMPLSGIFYPVSALPGFLQPLALSLPTTHAFIALRALVDGRGIEWNQLALAAVLTVVLLALSLLYVTKMIALFRKRGYITRYS